MSVDKESEIGAIAAIGPFAAPPPTKYERLLARAKEVPAARTIVVHPCDETSLRGPIEAAEAGLIVPILVGPAVRIQAVAREHGLKIDSFEIIDAAHSEAAAAKGVELVRESKGELLMKGSLHTDATRISLIQAMSAVVAASTNAAVRTLHADARAFPSSAACDPANNEE
jgi:phosphotransacetylase